MKLSTGFLAPGFRLNGLDGQPVMLSDVRGRIVLLNFWSAECPWAERADHRIAELAAGWGGQVLWASIASNPHEPLELIQQSASARALPLVLLDPLQHAANLYGAETTPHFFLIDPYGTLRYQGGLDDVTFSQRTPTRSFIAEGVAALLAGNQPLVSSAPVFGCSIVRIQQEE